MSFTIPEEISMIVSSNPTNGATNISNDGSYFEVQLQDGLKIPKEALNVNIAVEEASIWWSVPNIITGQNDKIYITGPSVEDTLTSIQLGYSATTSFEIGLLKIEINGVNMPTGIFQVGNEFVVDSGVQAGNSYPILAVLQDTPTVQEFTIGSIDVQPSGINSFSRYRPAGTIHNYTLTIPQGLYDLAGINEAIARELEADGARIDPEPLITLSPDEATQKVQLRFNYATVSIDFTPNDTPREILGFDAQVYTPVPDNPLLAPNVAAFNQVNYFLIHSDLTNKGIRFNNNYNQTIGQVLIDVSPGSQIVSKPFNPARINAPELAGATRTTLRFWLTDDEDRRVNTNNEYWSARIVIHWLQPYVVGKS